MKGIKLGVIGICISLLGIAFAMNNFMAICLSLLGTLLSMIAYFIKH